MHHNKQRVMNSQGKLFIHIISTDELSDSLSVSPNASFTDYMIYPSLYHETICFERTKVRECFRRRELPFRFNLVDRLLLFVSGGIRCRVFETSWTLNYRIIVWAKNVSALHAAPDSQTVDT